MQKPTSSRWAMDRIIGKNPMGFFVPNKIHGFFVGDFFGTGIEGIQGITTVFLKQKSMGLMF